MERHERALGYQSFAIGPLVGIAELASRQGLDLYSFESDSGRTIHDAVRFFLDASDHPRLVRRYAQERQSRPSLEDGAGGLAWMEAYSRRFPSRRFEPYLRHSSFNRWLGGGATVYWRPIE